MKNEFDQIVSLTANLLKTYSDFALQKDLNLNELHVLYYIDKQGVCSPNVLITKWSLPKQTVTSICNKFIKKGYLKFERDPSDRRIKLFSMTENGHNFMDPINRFLTEVETKTVDQFGLEKFNKLLDGFHELETTLTNNMTTLQQSGDDYEEGKTE